MKASNINFHLGFGLICLIFSLCFFIGTFTFAQPTDDATTNFSKHNNKATRAVVIGISDYQNKEIPDLSFAHKDATVFVEFLKSNAGGSLPDEQIKVMLNEQATNARMVAALDWLIEQTENGDQCIIYFSGHGDVETKTRRQLGFLLPWDSPPQSYMAGAYPLYYLEQIISTLSIDKNAKVIVIADACRAGKLAGSSVGGTQLTSANLAKQFGNEVKILSCQANEYSLEGEQWGGGRGVFSYHLVDGLYGFADKNEDYKINLLEIGRYLEDNVADEVAPASQIPFTVGTKSQMISLVDPETFDQIREAKADPANQLFAAKGSKGSRSEEEIIANLSPASNTLYTDFQNKIKTKANLSTIDSLYQLLEQDEALTFLMPSINRTYSTALQDEVQQALNAFLNSDPYESNQFFFNPSNYHLYPAYLQKSIDLLEKDHYSIPALKAKKHFFEAYNIIRLLSESDDFDKPTRDSLRGVAGLSLDKAISLQPSASYLYYGKSFLYSHRTPSQIDSLLFYQQKTNELSPQWLLPYLKITDEYMYNIRDYKKAEEWLFKAQALKPEAYVLLEHFVWLYQTLGDTEKALEVSKKMVQVKPDLFNGYSNMGGVYFQEWDYSESEKWYAKALALNDDPITTAPKYYGYLLMATKRVHEGKQYFEKYINNKKTPYWKKAQYDLWYGMSLLNYTSNWLDADKYLKESLKRQHAEIGIGECLIWLAKSKIAQQKWVEARDLLEQAFARNTKFTNPYILGYSLYGEVEYQSGNIEKATAYFQLAEDISGAALFKVEALYRYGTIMLSENNLEKAKDLFGVCNWMTNKQNFLGYYGEALLYAKQNKTKLALLALEKALDRFYPFKEKILNEPLFYEIRGSEKFRALMEKHFPE